MNTSSLGPEAEFGPLQHAGEDVDGEGYQNIRKRPLAEFYKRGPATVKLGTFHLRFSKSFSSFVSLTSPLRSWISTFRETSLLSELPALGLYQRRDLVLKLSLALSISPPFQVIKNKWFVHRLNTGCFCSASTNTYTCCM